MTISIIVAHDQNRVIGNGNDLPWGRDLPNDLKYFKTLTEGHTVCMGMRTRESIGKDLPYRMNVVFTRDKSKIDNPFMFSSIDSFLKTVEPSDEVFVIGGKQIYEQFLPIADKLYITEIEAEFEGDTHFPEYDLSEWTLTHITKGIVDEKNLYPHKFKVYKRKTS